MGEGEQRRGWSNGKERQGRVIVLFHLPGLRTRLRALLPHLARLVGFVAIKLRSASISVSEKGPSTEYEKRIAFPKQNVYNGG